MGVRYCKNYSIEEQGINTLIDNFKIQEQHLNQQLYEPFKSIIMINQQSQKIVRCEVSGFSYQLIELIKKFREVSDEMNPFLTIIHDFKIQENLFLTKLTMHVDELRDGFNERLKSQQEKKNAWLLIDCISEAMFKLQQKQKFLFGISSKLIFQVQTPFGLDIYKLHLWNMKDAMSIYQQWMEDYKEFHIIDHEQLLDILPSPEILKLIKNGVQDPIYNGYKMDVFSFGILLLQCFLGESVLIRIYNNWNLTYDGEYVQDLIKLVPVEFQNLISLLTEQQCEERMDWIQLKKHLNYELKITRLFDRHSFEEFYYFPKPQPISDNLMSQQTMKTVEQNIQDMIISEHLIYRGEQKNGLKCGYGEVLNNKNEVIMRGEFQNDKLNGRGILYNQENFMPSLFDQGHLNVHMNGQGWEKFEGYFQDNIRVGKGRIIYKNGDIFECSFIDSMANGYGVYVYKDGLKINGYWLMDKYQQQTTSI